MRWLLELLIWVHWAWWEWSGWMAAGVMARFTATVVSLGFWETSKEKQLPHRILSFYTKRP